MMIDTLLSKKPLPPFIPRMGGQTILWSRGGAHFPRFIDVVPYGHIRIPLPQQTPAVDHLI